MAESYSKIFQDYSQSNVETTISETFEGLLGEWGYVARCASKQEIIYVNMQWELMPANAMILSIRSSTASEMQLEKLLSSSTKFMIFPRRMVIPTRGHCFAIIEGHKMHICAKTLDLNHPNSLVEMREILDDCPIIQSSETCHSLFRLD